MRSEEQLEQTGAHIAQHGREKSGRLETTAEIVELVDRAHADRAEGEGQFERI